ncbi:MAG: hypothetical protein AAF289_17680 [Cyanobacteria bacterium P01_A01_bin.135]
MEDPERRVVVTIRVSQSAAAAARTLASSENKTISEVVEEALLKTEAERLDNQA